jgi:hypothetical protein
MVREDEFPRCSGFRKFPLKPTPLERRGCGTIRLALVGIEHEEVHWAPNKVVVVLVARQREVIEVGLKPVGTIPIAVAGIRKNRLVVAPVP